MTTLNAIGGQVDPQRTTDSRIEAVVKHPAAADRIRVRVALQPVGNGSMTSALIFANAMPFNGSARLIMRDFARLLCRTSVTTFRPRFFFSKRHFLIGGAIIACVVLYNALEAQFRPHSNLSYVNFAAIFDPRAVTTDVQKESKFKDLKGSVVEWEGFVEEVDSSYVLVREKASTITFDVKLDIDSDARDRLTSLNIGAKIKYSGVLEQYGGLITPDYLTHGHILSVTAVNPDERMLWLATNEAAIFSGNAANQETAPTSTLAGPDSASKTPVQEGLAAASKQPVAEINAPPNPTTEPRTDMLAAPTSQPALSAQELPSSVESPAAFEASLVGDWKCKGLLMSVRQEASGLTLNQPNKGYHSTRVKIVDRSALFFWSNLGEIIVFRPTSPNSCIVDCYPPNAASVLEAGQSPSGAPKWQKMFKRVIGSSSTTSGDSEPSTP